MLYNKSYLYVFFSKKIKSTQFNNLINQQRQLSEKSGIDATAAASCSISVPEKEIIIGSLSDHSLNSQFCISNLKNLSHDFIMSQISLKYNILKDILLKKEFSWRHESYLI